MDGVLRRTLENDFDFSVDTVNVVINPSDQTVNLDVEGVDTSANGGFWIVHEGPANTTETEILEPQIPEMLLDVNREGVIKEAIAIPAVVANETRVQGRGLEGVAEDYLADVVVVSFHRALPDEEYPRLAVWNRGTREWSFVFYPVDDPESQYAGAESMVVVSDLAFTGKLGQFLVMEHDNRAGPDASVKRIYQVDFTQIESPMEVLEKTLVFDILPDLKAATKGPGVEKIGGLTIDRNGGVWIINDNASVKDNNGETILIQVGNLSPRAEEENSKKQSSVDNHRGDDIFVSYEASPSKRKESNKSRAKGKGKNH
jgi:Esterase-like activity of phytase